MIFDEKTLIVEITKILIFAFGAFALSMALTPIYTHFAYKNEWWRKVRTKAVDGKAAPIFLKLHAEKHKRHIPTMAGMVILFSVSIITLIFNLDRAQTYLPLFSFIFAGLLGLADDYFHVKGIADKTGGLSARAQAFWLTIIPLLGAYWFYFKLDWSIIHVPAVGNFNIGWLYIPLFIIVIFATSKSVGLTDGLDGLAGGLLSLAYGSYGFISLVQGKYGLAAFCATVVGTMLAYTWFNIYPARFFMGNSGSISLGATLGVIAMLTNSVFILPIIGFVFFVESGSSAIQLLSKKIRGKKIFLSAPIHHHFEAIGWPETKVTMRFWIIGGVMSVLGIIIGLLGRGQ
ncbi:MAG: phospho-N-acetylmuramoyl-pentapeptide-transferase [Patescibacteria group bacterium]|nr:phospho-N-acetylmuramoyl-pentapeptide-transferase [Patescibacteria group bacterium]